MMSLHPAGLTSAARFTAVVAGLLALSLGLALIAVAGIQPTIIAPVPLAGSGL